uniref:Uncharacterized protein n=1 Tax=Ananas comosus var. bracteatus TaxID=296719 RepID=A0A6V7PWI9_ANACO|nr:unnamed protein product [Ananas comosus var. bracteatus]
MAKSKTKHLSYISFPSQIISVLSYSTLQSLIDPPPSPSLAFLGTLCLGSVIPFSPIPCAQDSVRSSSSSSSFPAAEGEFWRQPDGMGYRPCLSFSEEYRGKPPEGRRKYLLVVVAGGSTNSATRSSTPSSSPTSSAPPLSSPSSKLTSSGATRVQSESMFHCTPASIESVFKESRTTGLRLRDIRSVDPSLWLMNSMPSLLIEDQGGETSDRFHHFVLNVRESEYAAWTLVNGYALNHVTISAHRLKSHIRSIKSLNQFIEDSGFKLNSEGGILKGYMLVLLKMDTNDSMMLHKINDFPKIRYLVVLDPKERFLMLLVLITIWMYKLLVKTGYDILMADFQIQRNIPADEKIISWSCGN